MALTKTQTIGFCEGVIEFLASNKDALAAKGVNADTWIAELRTRTTDTVKTEAEHEALKAKLRDTTASTRATADIAYRNASSRLNGAMGALGNETEVAIQAARLRSKISRKNRKIVDAAVNNAA
ncbi:MAG: hypothetical protein AABZ39_00860 [Spirochaetota bacterium]